MQQSEEEKGGEKQNSTENINPNWFLLKLLAKVVFLDYWFFIKFNTIVIVIEPDMTV